MIRISKKQKWGPVLATVLLVCLVGIAAADTFVGGIPLTTVQTGTVTGDLWFDATPAPNWGQQNVVKTFTLPTAATGSNVKWARLYVSAYCSHMQNDVAFTITNKWDGNGDGTYELVWPETGHAAFTYIYDPLTGETVGNDNTALGGGLHDPYKLINNHENRVTSDYFMWYDVTNLISSQTVNVNVDTTGSGDGRIKVITLVVAYDDPASTTQITYWVNQGHDVCSYYTEDTFGEAAVGTTSFDTTGVTGITSATLTADYMASSNGNYGFPTAENDFTYTGGTPPVTGTFTNHAIDRISDVQGAYSGVDSWDVTDTVTAASDVTFAYARYFPGTGTAAFYKIPLAFLVVKKPLAAPAPVAAFSADDTTPDVGQTVVFTDESTNTPTSWAWTIEGIENTDYQYVDSTSSTSQNPHVKFLVAGTYDVTLIATNTGGSDTEAKTDYITVTAAPVASIEVTLESSSVTLSNMIAGQDATGSTTMNVVASNGASWSVAASDGKTTNKGYMVNGATPLASAFQLGKNSTAYQALTSDYTSFMSGTTMGSFSATASLKQPVVAGDATGTYGITVTFTGAIS